MVSADSTEVGAAAEGCLGTEGAGIGPLLVRAPVLGAGGTAAVVGGAKELPAGLTAEGTTAEEEQEEVQLPAGAGAGAETALVVLMDALAALTEAALSAF